ncbi:chromosome segregation in meiosis protein 3 [Dendryphion nanum]|uniref:Chromosome segregation in meiosis protein n=1 Tax=Dendryphion nanum TaxID=256645 RepID=A0A9P9ELQ9_9PLEO|nr:chromosome segregation in meiosis protein 3 [Dendryphion nanum]
MALANPTHQDNIPSDDELDDILNGIIDGKDVFDTSEQPQTSSEKPVGVKDDALGLDEEIKIVKKRQPIPKLDDNLLLSAAGIPRLRRISKERLRFKGKGHEYGDIARMLNMYQLWLDDLYPRAKFADGLAMIEKLGHSKRLHVMRKEWIDEGKPRSTNEIEPEEEQERAQDEVIEQNTERMEDLDLEESRMIQPIPSMNEDGPDEDELEMLLAQSATPMPLMNPVAVQSKMVSTDEGMFADDMDAMAEMDMWP